MMIPGLQSGGTESNQAPQNRTPSMEDREAVPLELGKMCRGKKVC